MSIKNDRWSALSLKDRADLMNMYITNGISDLKEMKKHYNSFAPGGPIEIDEYGYSADITPAIVEANYPRENEVWKRADASNADMVQRLKQGSSRVTIPDWEDPRKVATHKMMSAGNYAVGNVQNINGQLFDFTDPKHGFKDPDRAAIDSAIKRGDYVEFDTEGDARYFAEHYKKHYNSFSGEEDTNTSIKSELQKRLYDGVFPWSYKYPIVRTSLALLGHKTQPDEFRDDIWAEYLNIPHEERHNIDSPKVVTSKYSPTIDRDSSTVYKTLSKIPQQYIDALVQHGNNLEYNQSKISPVLEYYFGDHTISKGHDDKGSYVSYYDLWDIAPLFKKGDESMGVGNPISFYDRVYLDDYYDIPEAFRGNPYITPAILTDTNAYMGTD